MLTAAFRSEGKSTNIEPKGHVADERYYGWEPKDPLIKETC